MRSFHARFADIPVRFLCVGGALLAAGSSLDAQSLKTVPRTRDLVDILENPGATPESREVFPGLPDLPPLELHPLQVNTFTAQELRLDPVTGEISYDLPATGDFAFADGVPNRPLEVPVNETDFIVDYTAAIQLGKALFWDMQLGSDGVQACATCHFHAGTDNRTKHVLNPGTNAGDTVLNTSGTNTTLTAGDFPFHKLVDPNTQGEPLLNPLNVERDSNDVVSSMGLRFRLFSDIPAPGPGAFIAGTDPAVLAPELGVDVADPMTPEFDGLRRVVGRNTPSVLATGHNYDNFWDGRARHDFNGGSPFGASDPFAHVFVDNGGALEATRPLIRFSSLASLATGPALSDVEMSFAGRTWPKIGKKLLQAGVTPLANQLVDTTDSVLGTLSNQGATPDRPGLNTTYLALIQQAFRADLWSNAGQHLVAAADPADAFDGMSLSIVADAALPAATDEFTQAEANFSLFFGLAVQSYLQILDPNDTPFDQFHEANPDEFLGIVTDIDPVKDGVQVVGLTEHQLLGYDLFQGTNLSRNNPREKSGNCNICHFSQELTEHSVRSIHGTMPGDLLTGADMVLSGYMLESFLNGPAKISMEMDGIDQSLDGNGDVSGSALADKGMYNIGVRPSAEDLGRGADDPFGFPLSLSALALQEQGFPVGTFSDPLAPVDDLPASLSPFVNPFPIGLDFPNINEQIFLPDEVSPTADLFVLPSGTFPNPNRVARQGAFKVPHLRNVELTGPYFHNGGILTLRQLVDFYARGGDFPVTNSADRDPLIVDLHLNFDAQFEDEEKAALVDFLLALTDERVRYEQAPFDHPELIVPIDGTAPDNPSGRDTLLADARFRLIEPVGAAGRGEPIPNFLDISSTPDLGPDHFDVITEELISFFMAAPVPSVAGVTNTFNAGGGTPGALVGLLLSTKQGNAVLNLGACGGIQLGLGLPFRLLQKGIVGPDGTVSFNIPVPGTLVGKTFYFQIVEPATCRTSNVTQATF